jgi:hypothetical protein
MSRRKESLMKSKEVSLRQAVRLKCLDCTNKQLKEIELCPCQRSCALWPWRGGRIPREDWELKHPFLGNFLVKGKPITEAKRERGRRAFKKATMAARISKKQLPRVAYPLEE